MYLLTNITEEDLTTAIEQLNLSIDPEFIEKVRRNNIEIMKAQQEFDESSINDMDMES